MKASVEVMNIAATFGSHFAVSHPGVGFCALAFMRAGMCWFMFVLGKGVAGCQW